MTVDARPLNITDPAQVRSHLEHLLHERQETLAELEPHALPTIDPVAFQTAAAHRIAVKQLTAALDRLDAGAYGKCVRCHNDIAPARLEAMPHASACIACQSLADTA